MVGGRLRDELWLAWALSQWATMIAPAPIVTKPERRQQVDGCRCGSPVGDGDPGEDLVLIRFGIFDQHVKIAILGKDAGVVQFVLVRVIATLLIFTHQLGIGKGGLGIVVEQLHVTVGGGAIEVEVTFLDIFAVVAFWAGEAKEPLFEDRVAAIPKRKGEAEILVAVRDPCQPIFIPAVDPATGVVMGEIMPGVAIGAVIFAHGAPGALAQIRPPMFPVGDSLAIGKQALMFSGVGHGRVLGW